MIKNIIAHTLISLFLVLLIPAALILIIMVLLGWRQFDDYTDKLFGDL